MEMVAERTTDWQFGRLTDRSIVFNCFDFIFNLDWSIGRSADW